MSAYLSTQLESQKSNLLWRTKKATRTNTCYTLNGPQGSRLNCVFSSRSALFLVKKVFPVKSVGQIKNCCARADRSKALNAPSPSSSPPLLPPPPSPPPPPPPQPGNRSHVIRRRRKRPHSTKEKQNQTMFYGLLGLLNIFKYLTFNILLPFLIFGDAQLHKPQEQLSIVICADILYK